MNYSLAGPAAPEVRTTPVLTTLAGHLSETSVPDRRGLRRPS